MLTTRLLISVVLSLNITFFRTMEERVWSLLDTFAIPSDTEAADSWKDFSDVIGGGLGVGGRGGVGREDEGVAERVFVRLWNSESRSIRG